MKLSMYSIFLGIILLFACTNETKEPTSKIEPNKKMEKTTEKAEASKTLKAILDEKKAAFNAKAPAAKKKLYAEGIKDVAENGVLESAKNKGDIAPNFSLKNATGTEVNLTDQLKKGPVVLTWYRGGWCPYCNLTLNSLQEELPNFKALGASLIALTPEVPDKSLSTKEKNSLEFEILSDVGNKIAKEYGIVFELIPGVASAYQNGFDLHGYNGDESNELPLAATYIIDQKGIIRYAFLDADYRNRAEPVDILKALKGVKQVH